MGDDDKSKASAESLAEAEKEHRELMAALLKKLDVLSSLEERLGRIEQTQKQMSLHAQGPELLQQCKEGPLGHTRFHKLEFPSYDGIGDPLPFLNRCEHYFRGQRTLEEEQVWLAALLLLAPDACTTAARRRRALMAPILNPPGHALWTSHQIQSTRRVSSMPTLRISGGLPRTVPGASHPRRTPVGITASSTLHRWPRRASQH